MSNTYMDNILHSLVIPCLTKLIENLDKWVSTSILHLSMSYVSDINEEQLI